jgi:hypothetical protein
VAIIAASTLATLLISVFHSSKPADVLEQEAAQPDVAVAAIAAANEIERHSPFALIPGSLWPNVVLADLRSVALPDSLAVS